MRSSSIFSALFLFALLSGASCSTTPTGPPPHSGGATSTTGGQLASGGLSTGNGMSGGAANENKNSGGSPNETDSSGGTDNSGLGIGGTSPGNAGGTTSGGGSETTGNGGAGTGGSQNTGAGGNSGSGGWMGIDPSGCNAPIDLGVHFVGRHDGCVEGGVRMSWSGTGFVARIEGTGLELTMDHDGDSIQYTVVVDGTVMENLITGAGAQQYQAVTGLTSGEHLIEIYRRGEGHFGPGVLRELKAIGGQLLSPPPGDSRQIEIIGDSISCGYGNEGSDASCPFSADTENHYLAYGAILGRKFDAEVSTVAWSGKGIASNYDGDQSTHMPELYERTIADDAATIWRFQPKANLTIINLGTNDYSTDNDPSDDVFVQEYTALLESVRAHHPDAHILCTIGPLLGDPDLAVARRNIEAAVVSRHDDGDTNISTYELAPNNPDPGCDYHPSTTTHQSMADELAAPIAQMMGW